MTKTQIQEKFKDLSIDRLRLYICALTELLHSKVIAEKYPIIQRPDPRQITIEEALEGLQ
ncbi:MAG: hypothetical protein K6E29_09270 [Cyanobacteria bacterium RUI128]|nr:hypothetical protein [Cyanobacteria bacterium RUI128]